MSTKNPFLSLLLLLILFASQIHAQVRLPRLVSDSMVLQRDSKLKIWGWAAPGEKIRVAFKGKTYRTAADRDGKWAVSFPPLSAGGPYNMEIQGSNKIVLRDVLVGDVWLCAGQSNMVHYLDLHKDRYAREIVAANHPAIRQFLVPAAPALGGTRDDFENGSWKTATQGNIMRFTVVAYFFAKALHEKYNVPIGIINASVGGTPAEAWISEPGLAAFPDLISRIRQNEDTAYVNGLQRAQRAYGQEQGKILQQDKGMRSSPTWFDDSYVPSGWKRISIPGYWEDQGTTSLDGVVWYRREIEVPAAMAGKKARLEMGRIVDADNVYVNGVQVGSTGYQYPQRRYTIPEGLLKSGKNTIVVRVVNYGGKGGFVPDKPYYIATNSDTVDLTGYWNYKVGLVFDPARKGPQGFNAQNQPAALFNGMVAPLLNYAVKGFVWYQGESNIGRAEQYKRLLPALISDWRKQFTKADAPFLAVQLPDFLEVAYWPGESEWARMREAQAVAMNIDRAGMVVTLGLGEWNDIHPGNKKPIGDRLALAARHIAYGERNLVWSGPVLKNSRVEGDSIILEFDHTGSGLTTNDGNALCHFAIAGEDKKFVWADATIRGNTIVVRSTAVSKPEFVRYAWADSPDCANLYNKEGLPAAPFRTDE